MLRQNTNQGYDQMSASIRNWRPTILNMLSGSIKQEIHIHDWQAKMF